MDYQMEAHIEHDLEVGLAAVSRVLLRDYPLYIPEP